MSLQRKRFMFGLPAAFALLLTGAAVSSAGFGEPRDAGSDFHLTVDLSDRNLSVVKNDETVRSYQVAIGTEDHPTPKGDFRISRVIWNPKWVPPNSKWARGKQARGPGDPRNPMGRVKMFFVTPDYYIHGTREEDSLGRAESHGCIRMRNSEVIDLARIVMENGGEQREPGWFQRVINRVRSTQEVRLSEPVLFTVQE